MKRVFLIPISKNDGLSAAESFIKSFNVPDTPDLTTAFGVITEDKMDITPLLQANKNQLELTHVIYTARYNMARYLDKGMMEVEGDVYFFVNPERKLSKKAFDANYIDWTNLPFDVNIFNSKMNGGELSLDDLLCGCNDFDAIICKATIKEKFNYWFESYYSPVEKYRFCINALLHGCKVGCVKKQLMAVEDFDCISSYYTKKMKKIFYPQNNGDLTCVIAFINEKEELERTVSSIRYTADNVQILVLDDCSDDDFPYKEIAEKYHCRYEKAPERIGSAGGKHLAAYMVETKYFCFFDCHMRLYNDNWDKEIIGYLQEHPKSIISPRTIYMQVDDDGLINNEDGYDGKGRVGNSACCSVTFQPSYEFDPKWTDTFVDNDKSNKLSPVCCVLGAVYAMESDWWREIHGFSGLQVYGLEETLMSMKTYLMGGTCYVIKGWGVGHIYRKKNSAPVNPRYVDANRIFLTHLFREDKLEEYKQTLSKRIGSEKYSISEDIYRDMEDLLKAEKEYLESKKVRTIDEFLEFDRQVSNSEHLPHVK